MSSIPKTKKTKSMFSRMFAKKKTSKASPSEEVTQSENTATTRRNSERTVEGEAAFTNAKHIMECVDAGIPFECIESIVVEDAPFICQADALADVKTVRAWADWMDKFCAMTAPGCTRTVHSTLWDPSTKTCMLFGTYHAKHTGEGGPVPPTHKQTNTEYCYVLVMNNDDKCVSFTKVWNDGFALKELGWA